MAKTPRDRVVSIFDLVAERQQSYDTPTKNFRRIAQMWSAIFDIDVTEKQVAMCMIAMKIAREVHNAKDDNWDDMLGYIVCWLQIDEERMANAIQVELEDESFTTLDPDQPHPQWVQDRIREQDWYNNGLEGLDAQA